MVSNGPRADAAGAAAAGPPSDEGLRTVVVALLANLGVAVAKLAAAAVTGSTALWAETAHAFADTGNQVLLLIAQRRSRRRADMAHPAGYGRDAYFWALIASIGVFAAGAFFSLREGVVDLFGRTEMSSVGVGYAVLLVAAILDSVSLRQALRALRAEAQVFGRTLLRHLLLTSDPTVRAVFAEDVAAIAGDGLAALGLALHQLTGSAVPDAGAAIAIGLLVAGVGIQLTRRNRDFILGEQADATIRARIEASIAAHPGVCSVRELLVTIVGPRRLWVVARVDIDDTLDGAEVEKLAGAIEGDLRSTWAPYVARVDVVPAGG
jgi:cation diffusion facilitator family transporter